MTFDHRHVHGGGGGSMIFIVNVSSDRKYYRRSSNTGLLIPLYLTILHLCLFIHNGEALQKDTQYQNPMSMVASLSSKTHEFRASGLSLGEGRLIKRSVPAQSVPSKEDATKVTDPNSVKPVESASSSISTVTIKESIKKSDRKATFVTDSDTQEPSKTGTPVPSKAVSTVTEAVGLNGTTKVKASNASKDTEALDDEELGHGLPSGLKPDAVLRLFYVFVAVGVIVLLYLLIKFVRFRRKRATRKYRVLAHSDEQEMFPLAADDGDDEEIFNAADHQTHK